MEIIQKLKNKRSLLYIIIAVVILILALVSFYVYNQFKKREANPVNKEIAAPTKEPLKTNPFETKTNPFKDVKTNPFR
ncbi:MAG: hypothetical protein HYW86_05035 [Candidatus Roizmanbacteria bacterium]|nr:MAG: hypothetical protein HYW86_05035 [Candidatus Roizmanbacteria bacterium]